MTSPVKIALAVGLLVAGLVLLIFLVPAPSSPSGAPPTPRPAAAARGDLARDYEDPDEDAVMEVEDILLDFAGQMRRGAWAGALHHVAPEFEGTALLRDAEGETQVIGGVTVVSAGPDP